MKTLVAISAVAVACSASAACGNESTGPSPTPGPTDLRPVPQDPTPPGVTFGDEFNGPAGASPDPSKWVYERDMRSDWAGETAAYTDSSANVRLNGQGQLEITAMRTSDGGGYTSAQLSTRDRFAGTYGTFVARIKVASGQGLWSAFHLRSQNFNGSNAQETGQIDIMDHRGIQLDTIYSGVEGAGYWGANRSSFALTLQEEHPYSDDYHTFAVERRRGIMTFAWDDLRYYQSAPGTIPAGAKWLFDDTPFFLILNLAVGGLFAGEPAPGQGAAEIGKILVDYVHFTPDLSMMAAPSLANQMFHVIPQSDVPRPSPPVVIQRPAAPPAASGVRQPAEPPRRTPMGMSH